MMALMIDLFALSLQTCPVGDLNTGVAYGKNFNIFLYIFQCKCSQRNSLNVLLIFYIVIHFTGYKNAARYREGFHPGGDVDAITINCIVFNHHIARVYTDPQGNLWTGLHIQLNGKSGSHCLDGAGETAKRSIAAKLKHLTMMRGYFFFQLFLKLVPKVSGQALHRLA